MALFSDHLGINLKCLKIKLQEQPYDVANEFFEHISLLWNWVLKQLATYNVLANILHIIKVILITAFCLNATVSHSYSKPIESMGT